MKILILFLLPLFASSQITAELGYISTGNTFGKLAYCKAWGGYIVYYPDNDRKHTETGRHEQTSVMAGAIRRSGECCFSLGIGRYTCLTPSWNNKGTWHYSKKHLLNYEAGFTYTYKLLSIDFGYNWLLGIYSGIGVNIKL